MIKVSYTELVAILNYHSKKYYVDSSPEISDEEYDGLYQMLLEYEKEHPDKIHPASPSQRVGHPITSGDIVKYEHIVKMASLDNAFTTDDFQKFTDTILNEEYAVELKFDGASLELEYVYGHLVAASTRGDGKTGELVTHAAKAIKSIPLYIEELKSVHKIQIRGEVIMPYEAAEEYKAKNPEKQVISPRNIAAGSLRLLDPKEIADRKLVFIPHSLGYFPENYLHSFKEFNQKCKRWGFRRITTQVVQTAQEVVNLYNRFLEYRKKLPFAADGIVVKVNNFQRHEIYGETVKFPKWAIAWKFPSEEKQVVLKAVECQVGRSGVITPVAVFDPVELSGVMVTNATLHNYGDIQRKDIRMGDTIVVTRSGDVIPKVLRSVPENRTGAEELINPPEKCPDCGHPLHIGRTYVTCINTECRGQVIQRFSHFGSRGAMNINGFGEAQAVIMYDTLGIRSLSQLMKFDFRAYAETVTQKKTYTKLADEFDRIKAHTDPVRLLYGFGITGIGEVQAEEIVKYLQANKRNLTEFCTDPKLREQLTEVAGIGQLTLAGIEKYIGNVSVRKDILDVISLCNIKFPEISGGTDILKGKTFVITGTLTVPRKEMEQLIKANGGKISGSVSKKTTYLLAGENAGNDKTEAAKKNNVEVISEEKIMEMIG